MHTIQRGMSARMSSMSYRAWVEAGAQGYFLAPSVAINEARLIRRDLSDPTREERRRQPHGVDRPRPEWNGDHPNWIVTARVERSAKLVQRGWLTWETVGVVADNVNDGKE